MLLFLTALYATHLIWLGMCGVLRTERMRIKGIDPVAYYSYFHSVYFDHDLDFANQYQKFGEGFLIPVRTRTSMTATAHSCGPAIALAPFWIAADFIARWGGWTRDGASTPYHVAGFIGLMFYGWVALLLMGLWVERHFGAWAGAGGAAIAWGAGPLLDNCMPLTLMPHAIGAAAATLFLFASDHFFREESEKTPARRKLFGAALTGFILGVAMLMRWQNLLFAIYPMALSARRALHKNDPSSAMSTEGAAKSTSLSQDIKSEICAWMTLIAAAAVAFSPQMISWTIIFGSPLTMPRQGLERALNPEIIGVLFSMRCGLFTWTPAMGLGLIGLLFAGREQRWQAGALFAIFLAQLYVNSAVPDWTADWGFGMRRFTESAPLFAFGWAALLIFKRARRVRWDLAAAGALLILWTELFVFQYNYHMISWDRPLTMHEMFGDKLHLNKSYTRRLAIAVAHNLIRQGDKPRALQFLKTGLELDPWHVDIYQDMGRLLETMGEDENALACYDRALKIDPTHPEILRLRVEVLRELGR